MATNPNPNRNVFLPDDVSRCGPSQPCDDKERCARYMAPVPQYATIIDGSFSATSWGCRCPHYLPVDQFVRVPARKRKYVQQPTHHKHWDDHS